MGGHENIVYIRDGPLQAFSTPSRWSFNSVYLARLSENSKC